jgi:hypothetical protein
VNNDNQSLIEIEDAEIISAEDLLTNFGLVDRSTVEGIATNMVEHWRGKVAGGYIPVAKAQIEKARSNGGFLAEWRKIYDVGGNEIIVRPGNKREQGDLLMADAIRVTQKTLSRGLNPLAHISIWYQNGQLIDNVNYTIIIGMAEQQGASSFEFADMTSEDITRHNLKPVDIGKVAYLIMDIDKPLLVQATMQFSAELGFAEAKHQALEMIKKAKGIGIVRKDEGLYALKGRSLDWTAEKRAGTDAIRRAFGEMTPAQIAHYASGQGFLRQQDLKTLSSPGFRVMADEDSETQNRYLAAVHQAEDIKAGNGNLSPGDLKNANELMNRTGDDDPLGVSEVVFPHGMEASTKFWQFANEKGIERQVAGNYISQANGDFDKAFELLKEAQVAN